MIQYQEEKSNIETELEVAKCESRTFQAKILELEVEMESIELSTKEL